MLIILYTCIFIYGVLVITFNRRITIALNNGYNEKFYIFMKFVGYTAIIVSVIVLCLLIFK